MRRQGAMRLSITIDTDLVEWLDDYAWSHHVTKSAVIEDLVKALYYEITGEEWVTFDEDMNDASEN